jgi:hypothetical protein
MVCYNQIREIALSGVESGLSFVGRGDSFAAHPERFQIAFDATVFLIAVWLAIKIYYLLFGRSRPKLVVEPPPGALLSCLTLSTGFWVCANM